MDVHDKYAIRIMTMIARSKNKDDQHNVIISFA